MKSSRAHRRRPAEPSCPADDELTELLAVLLERAWRRRHLGGTALSPEPRSERLLASLVEQDAEADR